MNNASYIVLSRQSGLSKELTSIANNIANIDTVGYRRDGQFYSEYIRRSENGDRSISQTDSGGRFLDSTAGAPVNTGAAFDIAIDGEGYFAIETARGIRLTRAGSFTPDANGRLATPDGDTVLDSASTAITIPPDATDVMISIDGVISAGGNAIAQLGLFTAPPDSLIRDGGVLLRTEEDIAPVQDPQMRQGFLEDSNVNPVIELARLIEVQRAFELNQQLLQDENERIRSTIDNLHR
ncbi:MAG: flagellar hook-basal body complex protein [Pseudomonadota bacterium]